MVNVMHFHKVLILVLISGVVYVSASDIHNQTSKILLSDSIIGLEREIIEDCGSNCGTKANRYINKQVNGLLEHFEIIVPYLNGNFLANDTEYAKCMQECVLASILNATVLLKLDVLFAYTRPHADIAGVLGHIGSEIKDEVNEIWSDSEDEKSEEYANPSAENGKYVPSGTSVFTYERVLGLAIWVFHEFFHDDNVPRTESGRWDGDSYSYLMCGVCYSIPGPIRRGVVMRFIGSLTNADWVGVTMWPHHYCRSYSPNGLNPGLGEVASIRNRGGYIWMGQSSVGLFYILCDGDEGLPDRDTGLWAYWETKWLD